MQNRWLSGSLVDDLVHAAEGGNIDIDAIPALIVFQNGKEVTRFVGVQDIAKLKAALQ